MCFQRSREKFIEWVTSSFWKKRKKKTPYHKQSLSYVSLCRYHLTPIRIKQQKNIYSIHRYKIIKYLLNLSKLFVHVELSWYTSWGSCNIISLESNVYWTVHFVIVEEVQPAKRTPPKTSRTKAPTHNKLRTSRPMW